MIKAAANVAAGGNSDDDIWRVLPARAPVSMGKLDKTLHRWPKIIGELRAFDTDPNMLRIDAAKAIGRAENEILCDRAVENALDAEFLLHPFRHVEHAPFILRGHILPPQECVRIYSKFFFERLVNSLDKLNTFRLAFGRGEGIEFHVDVMGLRRKRLSLI